MQSGERGRLTRCAVLIAAGQHGGGRVTCGDQIAAHCGGLRRQRGPPGLSYHRGKIAPVRPVGPQRVGSVISSLPYPAERAANHRTFAAWVRRNLPLHVDMSAKKKGNMRAC